MTRGKNQFPFPTRAQKPGRAPTSQLDALEALKEGRLWMLRPQGDLVQCRPRTKPILSRNKPHIDVFMEREVEGIITREEARQGYPNVAITEAA